MTVVADLSRSRWQILAAMPALAFLIWLLLIPMVSFVVRSFQTTGSTALTWANYATIFSDAAYRTSLVNSIQVAVLSTVLALTLAVPTALHLASTRGRARAWADALLTFPLSLPGVVIGFFVIVLFGRAGFAPMLSESVVGEAHLVIAYQMPGLMLAYMYFQLPRVLATLRGAAENLDPAVTEAARTLGASQTRATFTVILPALAPAIVAAAGIATASSLGAYGTVAALSEGFRVLPLDVAEQATTQRNAELASAMALTLAVTSLLFGVLGSRIAKLVHR